MMKGIEIFNKEQLKKDLPDIRPGDTVKVYQRIGEVSKKGKERIQVFEGLVIARKHGKGINSTITVRKISSGVGVERIFPLHSPAIEKIEMVKRGKVRRAKLYYLRKVKGKKARLKTKAFGAIGTEEKTEVKPEKMTQEEISEEKEEKEEKENKARGKPNKKNKNNGRVMEPVDIYA